MAVAVLGDLPYNAFEEQAVQALIDNINDDPQVQLVVHVGDLKGGGEPCSDELLARRHRQLQRLRPPLLYTPGDNDWTDCHRRSNGQYLPTERLAYLRRLFFADPTRSGGQQALRLQTQAAQPGFARYVEHAMVAHGGWLWATLHVVGSEDNGHPWDELASGAPDSRQHPRADRLAEQQGRQAAVRAWIDHVFAQAATQAAAGVVLVFQANPGLEHPIGSRPRRGHDRFVQHLRQRASAYGGPVWLLHGDHHRFLHDQPLARAEQGRNAGHQPAAPEVHRVQTDGSPVLRWVKMRANPAAPGGFEVEPQPLRLPRRR
jgi:hypothetical protein